MIEIYGSPVSNCYNTVLAALRFKDLTHKEFHIGASMDSSFRSRSPMGKIPYIVHAGQSISETSAIVEYLDEMTPGTALFPGDALMRARQRQLMKFVELYVESPARRLFPGVFWGQENEAVAVSEVRPVMERGLDAVDILLGDNNFFHDEPFSAADFYTFFSLALAALVTEKQYGWSLLANRPILARYLDKLNGVQFVDEIVAQRDGAMQAYLEKKAAEAAAQDQ
ncbi:MAG: glutathione S-transferase family protein [Pseudomonadales bacterium]|nr:glutathione S-transferase family protein [Pseudomonadales bacterium]